MRFGAMAAAIKERKKLAAHKRNRKNAIRLHLPFREIVPTGEKSPQFARAERRRSYARPRFEGSAKAARKRHAAARKGERVRAPFGSVTRLSPVPEDFFTWPKSKRRRWANDRERDRQQSAMDAMVRRGIPEDIARRQFGSL